MTVLPYNASQDPFASPSFSSMPMENVFSLLMMNSRLAESFNPLDSSDYSHSNPEHVVPYEEEVNVMKHFHTFGIPQSTTLKRKHDVPKESHSKSTKRTRSPISQNFLDQETEETERDESTKELLGNIKVKQHEFTKMIGFLERTIEDRPCNLTIKQQLLITLDYLGRKTSYRILGGIYEVSYATVQNILERVQPALENNTEFAPILERFATIIRQKKEIDEKAEKTLGRIGVERDEFLEMRDFLEQETKDQKKPSYNPKQNTRGLPIDIELLVALEHTAENPSLTELGKSYGISPGAAGNFVRRVKEVLAKEKEFTQILARIAITSGCEAEKTEEFLKRIDVTMDEFARMLAFLEEVYKGSRRYKLPIKKQLLMTLQSSSEMISPKKLSESYRIRPLTATKYVENITKALTEKFAPTLKRLAETKMIN